MFYCYFLLLLSAHFPLVFAPRVFAEFFHFPPLFFLHIKQNQQQEPYSFYLDALGFFYIFPSLPALLDDVYYTLNSSISTPSPII